MWPESCAPAPSRRRTCTAGCSGENEALTGAEVAPAASRDQASDADAELQEIAGRLELAAEAATERLDPEARSTSSPAWSGSAAAGSSWDRSTRSPRTSTPRRWPTWRSSRRQRADLEAALRELEKLIADTDRQIRTTFEETFAATARGFEELATQLFPGGSGRLRLVSERSGPARVIGGETPPPDAEAEDGAEGEEAETG